MDLSLALTRILLFKIPDLLLQKHCPRVNSVYASCWIAATEEEKLLQPL